jgi:hypothetical protein
VSRTAPAASLREALPKGAPLAVSRLRRDPKLMYLAVETFLGGYDPGRRDSRKSDQP